MRSDIVPGGISTDDHHTLQEFRASLGAEWTFLSDPERTIQKLSLIHIFGQENSNRNRSIGRYWRGFSRRVSGGRL